MDLLGLDTPSTSSAVNNNLGGSGMNGMSSSMGGGGDLSMGLMGLLDGIGGGLTTVNGECDAIRTVLVFFIMCSFFPFVETFFTPAYV